MCVAAVFYWQINKVMTGSCTKGKATVLYAAFTLVPVVLYGALFLLLIGVEEFTDLAIIGEGYARTLPLIIVGGLAVTLLTSLLFSIVVFVLKR